MPFYIVATEPKNSILFEAVADFISYQHQILLLVDQLLVYVPQLESTQV
jgi:hypothetical protein